MKGDVSTTVTDSTKIGKVFLQRQKKAATGQSRLFFSLRSGRTRALARLEIRAPGEMHP